MSLLDVHATTLALAGVKAEGLDGWPIFSPGAKSRDFVFTARDRIDDTPDRVRTVRDARFKYIRNFEPERPYLQRMAYAEVSNPTYNRMRQLHAEGKLNSDQRKFMAKQRPSEELYDLQSDPFELNNLAGDARHRATVERLRAVLAAWLKDTRDDSAAPENSADLDAEMKNLEKIVAGRVDKFFADACLLEQPFFRDPDKKVSDLLTEAKAKVGEEVSIVRFVRFQVGETAAE